MLFFIISATLIVSLLSLTGIIFFIFTGDRISKGLIYLVGLSAGTMMGSAFLHLLPEAAETLKVFDVNLVVIISFVFFFLLERILHWHHHHAFGNDRHLVGFLNLFGDLFHNFIDGVIIAASFELGLAVGVTTTVAVALHEIPQEIGDFGVLIHSGFSKVKATMANLLVSLSAIFGGILGYYLSEYSGSLLPFMSAFAGGGFIYIAASDLLPEIRQETEAKKSWVTFLFFLIGITITLIFK